MARKTTKTFLQADRAAKLSTDPVDASSSDVEDVKEIAKTNLQLMPLVSVVSIAPHTPKVNIATKNETVGNGTKQKLRLCFLTSAWSIEPPTQSAQSTSTNRSQQEQATNSSLLPSLPPFDHNAFSRFDNVRRPSDNDFGQIIEVQTNDGTFSHVHLGVLHQVPCLKESINRNLQGILNPRFDNRLSWRPASGFDGMSTIYVYWLYNGNLPSAAIDVSNERKIGIVLMRLAEEYAIGYKVRDGRYMNDIMDVFITLQVRTRWLALRSVVEVVFDTMPGSTKMRHMLADLHAFIVVDETESVNFGLLEAMPKVFVVDVLKSVVMLKPNEVSEWYHFLKNTGETYHV